MQHSPWPVELLLASYHFVKGAGHVITSTRSQEAITAKPLYNTIYIGEAHCAVQTGLLTRTA